MRPVALSLILLAMLLPFDSYAKTTDRSQPMDVESDHTDVEMGDNGDAVLTGNVKITQGTLEVGADKATIQRQDGEISQVVLTGAPATLKQVNDNGETMNARAAQITYYTAGKDLIVLSGDVVIEQPRGNLRGETIKYDLKTGRLDGGGDGSRVHMRIMPKTAGG
jgi:lipopolysaccharide export system protein LptA